MKKIRTSLLALGLLATVITTSTSAFAATKTSTSKDATTVSSTSEDATTVSSASIPTTITTAGMWGVYEYGQTTANVNVRTGPGTSYSIKTSLSKGAIVSVDGDSGNWYHICNPVGGWVSKDYIVAAPWY